MVTSVWATVRLLRYGIAAAERARQQDGRLIVRARYRAKARLRAGATSTHLCTWREGRTRMNGGIWNGGSGTCCGQSCQQSAHI